MKDKNGIHYTPLNKRQIEMFSHRLNELEDIGSKASLDYTNQRICLSEYSSITDQVCNELNGIRYVLARLGWKHNQQKRKIVRRNMGYEDYL